MTARSTGLVAAMLLCGAGHRFLWPAEILRWLKGRTGRKVNQILGRRGQAFRQDESYGHWVRRTKELNELIRYVENNPVQAGLVVDEAQRPWSSARMRADDTLPEADDELRSSTPRELLQM